MNVLEVALLDSVILVSPANRTQGYGEKLEVHRKGLRHRAFSVFLVDEFGRTLLQQRYEGKYHSGRLWANSCCGHPRPREPITQAAERRLFEELGIHVPLTPSFTTTYEAELDNGMIENEVVTIFFGRFAGGLEPNPLEVIDTKLVAPDDLARDIESNAPRYSYWLTYYMQDHFDAISAGCNAYATDAESSQPVLALATA